MMKLNTGGFCNSHNCYSSRFHSVNEISVQIPPYYFGSDLLYKTQSANC